MRRGPSAAAFAAAMALFVSSLAFGYALANRWLGEAAVLLSALMWVFAGRRRPDLCLAISVACAAAGVRLGVGPAWMIAGAAASLGLWDLERALAALAAEGPEADSRAYERLRLRSLALALGCGLALAFLALLARLSIGFPLMAAAALAVFACLDILWRLIGD